MKKVKQMFHLFFLYILKKKGEIISDFPLLLWSYRPLKGIKDIY